MSDLYLSKVVVGTPTPVMIPARKWAWFHVSGPHAIDVKYEGVNANGLYYEDDIDRHVSLGAVVKSLFTESLYPSLTDTQVFAISDLVVDVDKKIITIIGNIIEHADSFNKKGSEQDE